jgi:hypothetical protein
LNLLSGRQVVWAPLLWFQACRHPAFKVINNLPWHSEALAVDLWRYIFAEVTVELKKGVIIQKKFKNNKVFAEVKFAEYKAVKILLKCVKLKTCLKQTCRT